jgi:hypothetical protein
MRMSIRTLLAVWALASGSTLAHAELAYAEPEQHKPAAAPAAGQAMGADKAAMEAAMKLGAPGEAHQVIKSLAGTWNYAGKFQMSPESPAETMSGTTSNTMVMGDRFLKQETTGQMKDMPPFEGVGLLGYDNLRKEYQSIWHDNMNTSIMVSTGQYDPATKAFTFKGDFSCPMTGETHKTFRDVWTIIDPNTMKLESYMQAQDGREYKAMEITYTRS